MKSIERWYGTPAHGTNPGFRAPQVGALVPRELEATLVLIGVVGIQLSLDPSVVLAKILPFYGPERLIDSSLGSTFSVWTAVAASVAYAAALLVGSLLLMGRRVWSRAKWRP